MFKKTALTTLLVTTLSPMAVLAESPNWTFVEASYVSSEGSGGANLEPEGFEVAGSYGLGQWAFVDLRYLEEDDDTNTRILGTKGKLELTRERLSMGVGAAWRVVDTTDIYGRVAYEDWTLDAKFKFDGSNVSDDDNENGYSVGAGVRSMVWQALELRAEVNYVDVDKIMDGETGYQLGAYYTFAEHITVGASYEELDDYETYRATLRYQF